MADEILFREKVDRLALEEGIEEKIDFDKLFNLFYLDPTRGIPFVIPVVVQDTGSKEVLMLAYANEEALSYSLENGVAAFWSTSREELWIKGVTSGNVLILLEVRVNCEQNSLLYLVRPARGGACHTKDADGRYRKSCYYRAISADGERLEFSNKNERRGK